MATKFWSDTQFDESCTFNGENVFNGSNAFNGNNTFSKKNIFLDESEFNKSIQVYNSIIKQQYFILPEEEKIQTDIPTIGYGSVEYNRENFSINYNNISAVQNLNAGTYGSPGIEVARIFIPKVGMVDTRLVTISIMFNEVNGNHSSKWRIYIDNPSTSSYIELNSTNSYSKNIKLDSNKDTIHIFLIETGDSFNSGDEICKQIVCTVDQNSGVGYANKVSYGQSIIFEKDTYSDIDYNYKFELLPRRRLDYLSFDLIYGSGEKDYISLYDKYNDPDYGKLMPRTSLKSLYLDTYRKIKSDGSLGLEKEIGKAMNEFREDISTLKTRLDEQGFNSAPASNILSGFTQVGYFRQSGLMAQLEIPQSSLAALTSGLSYSINETASNYQSKTFNVLQPVVLTDENTGKQFTSASFDYIISEGYNHNNNKYKYTKWTAIIDCVNKNITFQKNSFFYSESSLTNDLELQPLMITWRTRY